jgi:hypothetical protein
VAERSSAGPQCDIIFDTLNNIHFTDQSGRSINRNGLWREGQMTLNGATLREAFDMRRDHASAVMDASKQMRICVGCLKGPPSGIFRRFAL